ncbi:membrane fusion protein, multidrug efflux system [Monaibacterium marinum]|uniref:Membrane fusion protein, multidrug efflux system n=1 Tax=Pontivivens marinum TaxID=1690039 RepID=A0A2C9CPT6_9RHOB|nr:efflux RND transporter periplasmic adaptor subunit [Monaibacterium marinum]SOH93238.1 membrane fusion protein, multidrug efflux system [Monaibacterium marinum]
MTHPNSTENGTPLAFDDTRRSGVSGWLAVLLTLALIAWMGSGYIYPTPSAPEEEPRQDGRRAATVATRHSMAEQISQFFVAEGQALPDRETMLRAETSGEIESLSVNKGEILERGVEIARIAPAERSAQLAQATAEIERAQREVANAQSLLERGVATQDRVTDANAALATAQAQLATVEQGLENTIIRAPFAGLLDDLSIDPGEYVQAGTEVGRIIDTDPLTIEVQVPQQAVSTIHAGQVATVNFITGETREGTVAYVSGSANAQTRTFRAEVEVPNPDGAIPAGVSAQIRVPVGTATAHFVSPAILALGTDGTLGIKTLEDGNIVGFAPVEIVRAQTDGIWISGLPDSATIITIGQGFVSAGEVVDPRDEAAIAAQDAAQ